MEFRRRGRTPHARSAPVSGLDPPRARRVFSAARKSGPGCFVVVVAQSVRAPDCGSGGCGFDSRQPPWLERSAECSFVPWSLASEPIA
jgi:hypothetical protein